MKFMPFDMVTYCGDKFRSEIKERTGEIVVPVEGNPGAYVVDFGNETYIVSERSLNRYRPSAKDKAEPVVNVRRRRFAEDE